MLLEFAERAQMRCLPTVGDRPYYPLVGYSRGVDGDVAYYCVSPDGGVLDTRLGLPVEPAAVALLLAEISDTQNRPLYFTDLMRGINPNAKNKPSVETKPDANAPDPTDGNN